ncbi:MAG: peptide deformylase [Bacilli bacterium]
MEIFKIVKDNKASIREASKPITMPLDEKLKTTLLDMIEYLKLSQDEDWSKEHNVRSGVGLAAPQIGMNINMLAIYYLDEKNKEHEFAFVNPKIISTSVKLAYLAGGEGCLSVDKEHPGYVYRPYKVTMKAFNLLTNKEEEHVFTGFGSMVFQHEFDHLKGVLFYDHIDKDDPMKKIPGAIEL